MLEVNNFTKSFIEDNKELKILNTVSISVKKEEFLKSISEQILFEWEIIITSHPDYLIIFQNYILKHLEMVEKDIKNKEVIIC